MKPAQVTTLKPGKFNLDNQNWSAINSCNEEITISSIKVVTYNVWFSDEHIDIRSKSLLAILETSQADIIALQEVTYHFLQILLMQTWIRQDYFISDFKGDTFSSYGVIMLCRFPITKLSLVELPSFMQRKLLLADFNINHHCFRVATVHLESTKAAADIRCEQLMTIFPLLAGADCSMLMGDLNFCVSAHENKKIDEHYTDAWQTLRPAEPGYTINSEINTMLSKPKTGESRLRIDRVLFRPAGSTWCLKSIELLGATTISQQAPGIFPSDHFGLLSELTQSDA